MWRCRTCTRLSNSTDLQKSIHEQQRRNTIVLGYENRRRELVTELNEWSNRGFPILLVIFTAAVGAKATSDVSAGTNCSEYFIRCDKTSTAAVFGEEFERLLQVASKGYTTLLEAYKEDEWDCENLIGVFLELLLKLLMDTIQSSMIWMCNQTEAGHRISDSPDAAESYLTRAGLVHAGFASGLVHAVPLQASPLRSRFLLAYHAVSLFGSSAVLSSSSLSPPPPSRIWSRVMPWEAFKRNAEAAITQKRTPQIVAGGWAGRRAGWSSPKVGRRAGKRLACKPCEKLKPILETSDQPTQLLRWPPILVKWPQFW